MNCSVRLWTRGLGAWTARCGKVINFHLRELGQAGATPRETSAFQKGRRPGETPSRRRASSSQLLVETHTSWPTIPSKFSFAPSAAPSFGPRMPLARTLSAPLVAATETTLAPPCDVSPRTPRPESRPSERVLPRRTYIDLRIRRQESPTVRKRSPRKSPVESAWHRPILRGHRDAGRGSHSRKWPRPSSIVPRAIRLPTSGCESAKTWPA